MVSSLFLAWLIAAGAAVGPSTRAMQVEGHDGVWLPAESAGRLLTCLDDFEHATARNALLVEQLEVRGKSLDLERQRSTIERSLRLASEEQVARSDAARYAADAKLNVWYRNPWLYGTLGILAGGVLIVEGIRTVR